MKKIIFIIMAILGLIILAFNWPKKQSKPYSPQFEVSKVMDVDKQINKAINESGFKDIAKLISAQKIQLNIKGKIRDLIECEFSEIKTDGHYKGLKLDKLYLLFDIELGYNISASTLKTNRYHVQDYFNEDKPVKEFYKWDYPDKKPEINVKEALLAIDKQAGDKFNMDSVRDLKLVFLKAKYRNAKVNHITGEYEFLEHLEDLRYHVQIKKFHTEVRLHPPEGQAIPPIDQSLTEGSLSISADGTLMHVSISGGYK